MRKYTKNDTKSAIRNLFPGEDPDENCGILESYGSEIYEYEVHRVRLGILKLSEGKKGRLLQMVKQANTDYRDILFGAEYTQPGDELIDNPYGIILQSSGTDANVK